MPNETDTASYKMKKNPVSFHSFGDNFRGAFCYLPARSISRRPSPLSMRQEWELRGHTGGRQATAGAHHQQAVSSFTGE